LNATLFVISGAFVSAGYACIRRYPVGPVARFDAPDEYFLW
jgi:hypothetical protein